MYFPSPCPVSALVLNHLGANPSPCANSDSPTSSGTPRSLRFRSHLLASSTTGRRRPSGRWHFCARTKFTRKGKSTGCLKKGKIALSSRYNGIKVLWMFLKKNCINFIFISTPHRPMLTYLVHVPLPPADRLEGGPGGQVKHQQRTVGACLNGRRAALGRFLPR